MKDNTFRFIGKLKFVGTGFSRSKLDQTHSCKHYKSCKQYNNSKHYNNSNSSKYYIINKHFKRNNLNVKYNNRRMRFKKVLDVRKPDSFY